ncbi:MAG: CHASE2 domain-containing protein, partial [Terriglobales bacterium]
MQPRILSRWFLRHAHAAIAFAVTAVGLVLFAYSGIGSNQGAGFVFLQDIEQRSLDLRFAMRGKREVDPRIVIVVIDEKTLQKVGSFPLPRSTYAALVRQLHNAGASVVGFDMTFPTPASSESLALLARLRHDLGNNGSPELEKKIEQLQQTSDADAEFATSLKDAGNVVLGHLFLEPERAKSVDPKLAEAYFNIIWAKSFPQVLKVASGKRDFDLGRA